MPLASAEQSLHSCSCVAATGDRCGQGAAWHAEEKAVYWTDINRFLIHRLTVTGSSVTTWYFDEPVTAIVCTYHPETLLVVFGSKVCLWSPRYNRVFRDIYRLAEWPTMRFNDAVQRCTRRWPRSTVDRNDNQQCGLGWFALRDLRIGWGTLQDRSGRQRSRLEAGDRHLQHT